MRSKGLENPNEFVELDDAVFATLDLDAVTPTVTNGVISYAAAPATLTAEGATGFAGFYEAGTALDPVTVAIALDGATLPPPGAGSGGNNVPTKPVANTRPTRDPTSDRFSRPAHCWCCSAPAC